MKKYGIFFILLAAIFMFTACTNTDPKPEEISTKKNSTHEMEYTKTANYLVNEGSSEYCIVYPNSATDIVKLAVSELTLFFEEATGITLKAITDNGLKFDTEKKYISIGSTALLNEAGIELNKNDLKSGGYIIKTVGKSIFLAGGYYGDLYAVYGYLKLQFGFTVYTEDEVYINTGITSTNLIDFNVKDIPDIEYRQSGYSLTKNALHRLKLNSTGDVFIPTNGAVYHNVLKLVPYSVYGTEHPEWYVWGKINNVEQPVQLNFTADKAGLSEAVLNEMKKYITSNPNIDNIAFTQEDNPYWSDNEATKANYEKYGTYAAEYIQFVNICAKGIKQWLKETNSGRNVKICIFAYANTRKPPVKKDENDKWVPIDDTVILEDNVVVIIACSQYSYYSLYDDKNKENRLIYDQWKAICNEAFFWSYNQTYFSHYYVPHPGINAMQQNYQFFYEYDGVFLYDQGQWNQPVATDWSKLKTYLQSELEWDVYQDPNILVDNFFDNYYKAASKPMKELFDKEQQWLSYLVEVAGEVDSSFSESNVDNFMLTEKSWPENLLISLLNKIDEAYAAIESCRNTDPELYKKIYDRINLESLSIRFLRYHLYSKYYPDEIKAEWHDSLYNDSVSLGLTYYAETKKLSVYF